MKDVVVCGSLGLLVEMME